jgi:hypothetical protein
MQAATTNTGEPNDYGQLLLLQEVRNADSRVVQYFVCNDCLDLVERKAGSIHVHDCPAMTQQKSEHAQPL